jgi:hypothetical protein
VCELRENIFIIILGIAIGIHICHVYISLFANCSMQNFGVNVSDDVAQQIERLRNRADDGEEPDIVSRSQVIRELIDIGLLAETVLDESAEDLELDEHADKRELVRQALIERLDE